MQAPTGGPPGVRTQGRKGDDGSHTASPPSPAEGQVTRLVPAPCLRRAYARGQTARTPPPPPPPSPPPAQERGEDSEETARGHGGGAEDRPTRRGERRAASGGDTRQPNKKKQSKPTCLGKTAGRQGPQRTGGGRGDKSPRETLVRYPDLRGLGAPPVSVSAPLERRQ